MPDVFFTHDPAEIATTLPPETPAFILERARPRSVPANTRVILLDAHGEPPPRLFDDHGQRLTGPEVARLGLSDPRVSAESRAAVLAWEARRRETARAQGSVLREALTAPARETPGEPPGGPHHVHLVREGRMTYAGRLELRRVDDVPVRARDVLAVWVGGVFRFAWVTAA